MGKGMDSRSKLARLMKLFSMKSDALMAIPIQLPEGEGFVLAQEHPTREGCVAPLAFVLPDELGQMFMDSDIFKNRADGSLTGEEEATSAIPMDELPLPEPSSPAMPTSESSEAPTSSVGVDDDQAVQAFAMGADGVPVPMSLENLPPHIQAILGKIIATATVIDKLEGLKKRLDRAGATFPQAGKPEGEAN